MWSTPSARAGPRHLPRRARSRQRLSGAFSVAASTPNWPWPALRRRAEPPGPRPPDVATANVLCWTSPPMISIWTRCRSWKNRYSLRRCGPVGNPRSLFSRPRDHQAARLPHAPGAEGRIIPWWASGSGSWYAEEPKHHVANASEPKRRPPPAPAAQAHYNDQRDWTPSSAHRPGRGETRLATAEQDSPQVASDHARLVELERRSAPPVRS